MKGTSTAGRKLGIALAVLLIGALAVVGLYKFREASKARALQQDRMVGMAAYERQAYAEAVPHLSRYVSKHRDDTEALLAFADSRRLVPAEDGSGSHITHAMAVTRLALERDPGSLKGRVMLMELSAASGFATETDRAALAVLELDPLQPQRPARAPRSSPVGRPKGPSPGDRPRDGREAAQGLPDPARRHGGSHRSRRPGAGA